MVDQRFSSSAFESCGLDSEEARQLADLLAEEVLNETQNVLEIHFADIIRRLNDMGHSLKPEVLSLGELSYRDDYQDDQAYHCKLRVALDVVVSTGYAHLVDSDPDEQRTS